MVDNNNDQDPVQVASGDESGAGTKEKVKSDPQEQLESAPEVAKNGNGVQIQNEEAQESVENGKPEEKSEKSVELGAVIPEVDETVETQPNPENILAKRPVISTASESSVLVMSPTSPRSMTTASISASGKTSI